MARRPERGGGHQAAAPGTARGPPPYSPAGKAAEAGRPSALLQQRGGRHAAALGTARCPSPHSPGSGAGYLGAVTALIPRPRAQVAPGAVHVPGWLDLEEQRRLVAACREWARPPAGMRATRLPTGGVMSVQTVCLGWHWQQAYDLFSSEGLHDNLMQWGAWNTLIRLYMAIVPPAGTVTRHDEALICS